MKEKNVVLDMRCVTSIFLILSFTNFSFSQDTLPIKAVTRGTASFYAKKFNGRKTASGEKFYNDSLTAAHKTLKFGTYVLVRNVKNDSTIVVRINDRLPQKSKRSIDLTVNAAKHLNFIKSGLTRVEITELDLPKH